MNSFEMAYAIRLMTPRSLSEPFDWKIRINVFQDILDCIKKLQFQDVEHCWSNFWQPDEEIDLEDEDPLQE